MQVGSLHDVISWKHYVSIEVQHVKPIHRLRMPAGMRVTILTPGSNLLKHGHSNRNDYQKLIY